MRQGAFPDYMLDLNTSSFSEASKFTDNVAVAGGALYVGGFGVVPLP